MAPGSPHPPPAQRTARSPVFSTRIDAQEAASFRGGPSSVNVTRIGSCVALATMALGLGLPAAAPREHAPETTSTRTSETPRLPRRPMTADLTGPTIRSSVVGRSDATQQAGVSSLAHDGEPSTRIGGAGYSPITDQRTPIMMKKPVKS